jgi:hypothetical protein
MSKLTCFNQIKEELQRLLDGNHDQYFRNQIYNILKLINEKEDFLDSIESVIFKEDYDDRYDNAWRHNTYYKGD